MLPERAHHRRRRCGRWAHGRARQRSAQTSASPAWRSRRWDIASRVTDVLPQASAADDVVFDAAAAKTDDEIANAREATRIAELGYARHARDRASGHERGRARGRAALVHQDARRRGQFPAAVRRPAQSRGGALERTDHAAGRHPGGRDHAELSRAARADLPHRHARAARATSSRTNTTCSCVP